MRTRFNNVTVSEGLVHIVVSRCPKLSSWPCAASPLHCAGQMVYSAFLVHPTATDGTKAQ
jgi:hypothetical protein